MVIGSCQQRFFLVFVSEVLVHSLGAACIRGPTAGDDTNTRMLKDVTGHLSLAKLQNCTCQRRGTPFAGRIRQLNGSAILAGLDTSWVSFSSSSEE